jgi:DNA-directed RNA polymerase specialized sigma24 family protein
MTDPQPGGDLDGDLIQRIKRGSAAEAEAASEELVVRHQSHLLSELRLMGLTTTEQEDVANETWARAFAKISRFELRGMDIFPWLRKIAKNVALENFRHRYLSETPDQAHEVEEEPADVDAEAGIVQRLSLEEFRRALNDVMREARENAYTAVGCRGTLGY